MCYVAERLYERSTQQQTWYVLFGLVSRFDSVLGFIGYMDLYPGYYHNNHKVADKTASAILGVNVPWLQR